MFKGEAHGIFAIGNAFINGRGAAQQFAVQLFAELGYIIPALGSVAAAHSIQHVHQMFKGGGGSRRVAESDFAFQFRI